MKDKTYRRLFGETNRQRRQRHNAVAPAAPDHYTARRSRTGDGFEVANTSGLIVAQAFDTIEEAEAWAAENQPRQPG